MDTCLVAAALRTKHQVDFADLQSPGFHGVADLVGDSLLLAVRTSQVGAHAVSITKGTDGFTVYDSGLMMRPPTRAFKTLDEAVASLVAPSPEGVGARA